MDEDTRMAGNGEAADAGARPLPPAGPALDRAHLARMTLGDRHLEEEVLGLFCQQAETLVAGMRASDIAGTAALAHALKGAAGGVGAFRVAAAAAEIETCASGPSEARETALMRLEAAVAEARAAIGAALAAT